MKESDKRPCASFVPYRKRGDEWEFFLQKRGSTFKLLPNMFAFFGGGIKEGETIEQGCAREVMEELVYVPKHLEYFARYEFAESVLHLFIEKVGESFEKEVRVCEGEYGAFKSFSEMHHNPEVAVSSQVVLVQLNAFLNTRV